MLYSSVAKLCYFKFVYDIDSTSTPKVPSLAGTKCMITVLTGSMGHNHKVVGSNPSPNIRSLCEEGDATAYLL